VLKRFPYYLWGDFLKRRNLAAASSQIVHLHVGKGGSMSVSGAGLPSTKIVTNLSSVIELPFKLMQIAKLFPSKKTSVAAGAQIANQRGRCRKRAAKVHICLRFTAASSGQGWRLRSRAPTEVQGPAISRPSGSKQSSETSRSSHPSLQSIRINQAPQEFQSERQTR
jgi:hypothetical protein